MTFEYDFFKPRTFNIAQKLTTKTFGYKFAYLIDFLTLRIFHKSENYFDRKYKEVAKLYYDINSDTATCVQLSTPKDNEKIGLWKDIIEDLKPADKIIIDKLNIHTTFSKLKDYFPSKEKFIFVPSNLFQKGKNND